MGCSTVCGRFTPTTVTPSPGRVFMVVHIKAPPAPALYCTTVSTAGQRFFKTNCWCRAERSDSPPGGKACQYMTFFSGQGWAWAGDIMVSAAAASPAVETSKRVREFNACSCDERSWKVATMCPKKHRLSCRECPKPPCWLTV